MPRKLKEHLVGYFGYIFPIVCKILDEIGPPKIYRDIPQPERDDRIVDLAVILARSCIFIVMRGERMGSEMFLTSDLLKKHGGQEYRDLVQKREFILNKYGKVLFELSDLERKAYHLADSKGSRLVDGSSRVETIYKWRYDLIPADEIDPVRRRYEIAKIKALCLEKQLHILEAKIDPLIRQTQLSPEYIEDYEQSKWMHVKVNFDDNPLLLAQGLPQYLRNLNYDWWVDFTTHFSKQVEEDGRRAPLRIALRNHGFLMAVDGRAKAAVWNEAAAALFNEWDEWGVGKPTSDQIKSMRYRLRKEDQKGLEWLRCHGCSDNFYDIE